MGVIASDREGPQGPPGPPGSGGGAADVTTLPARGTINGHRIVRIVKSGAVDSVEHADASTLLDSHVVLGLSLNAAADGDPVSVQTAGVVEEPSWNWTPGAILYCGADGALTQTYDPAWAWVVIVGAAFGPTSILVRIRTAVVLT